jgi:hypothetical protein
MTSKRGRQPSMTISKFQEGPHYNIAIRLYHPREQVRVCQKLHKALTLCGLRTSATPKTVPRSACAQGQAHPYHQRHFDWLHFRLLVVLAPDARCFLQGWDVPARQLGILSLLLNSSRCENDLLFPHPGGVHFGNGSSF